MVMAASATTTTRRMLGIFVNESFLFEYFYYIFGLIAVDVSPSFRSCLHVAARISEICFFIGRTRLFGVDRTMSGVFFISTLDLRMSHEPE